MMMAMLQINELQMYFGWVRVCVAKDKISAQPQMVRAAAAAAKKVCRSCKLHRVTHTHSILIYIIWWFVDIPLPNANFAVDILTAILSLPLIYLPSYVTPDMRLEYQKHEKHSPKGNAWKWVFESVEEGVPDNDDGVASRLFFEKFTSFCELWVGQVKRA